jgi:hypothetical protein
VKIPFARIGASPRPVTLTEAHLTLEGILQRSDSREVVFEGHFRGEAALVCDRCGQPYTAHVDEALKLQISDGVARDKEDLDIIEFFDGSIDLDQILQSEISALEGDYHFCPSCGEADEILDIEL